VNAGIPTAYRGVRFRSRLEARWAAFLDGLGWSWAYEPIDLFGYIPDFICHHEGGELLIEIKPAVALADLRDHREKINRSGWEKEALIVGASLFDNGTASPDFGLLRSRTDEPGWSWDTGVSFRCLSCGKLSVLSESLSWHCRVCGYYDGNAHVGTADGIDELWAAAGNRVQWMAA